MILLILLASILASAYIIMICLYIIGFSRTGETAPGANAGKVPISIVVAFRNERENLPQLIQSIASQDYPKDNFELILVDDHSTDDSVALIRKTNFQGLNINLYQLHEFEFGKKSAIITGINSAKFPLIAITDADCTPAKGWLNKISEYAGAGYVLIIGPVFIKSNNTFQSNIQALEYSSLMSVAAGSAGCSHPVIASSANLAIRNDILKINKSTLVPSVSSGDDMFILHHAKKEKGGKIAFMKTPKALVFSSPAKNIYDAFRQRQRWASKSLKYTDFDTIFAGLLVLTFNLLTISVFIFSMFKPLFFLIYSGLIIIKSIVDYILLFNYLSSFGQTRLLKVFIPLQLIYPFYMVFAFFSGLFKRSRWKQRKIT